MASLLLSPPLRKVNRTAVSSIWTTTAATPLNTINKTLSGFRPMMLNNPSPCTATATNFSATCYFGGAASSGKRFYAQQAFKHQEITDFEFTLLVQKFTDSLSSEEITRLLIIVTPYVVSLLRMEAPAALKSFFDGYLTRTKFLSTTTTDAITSEGITMKNYRWNQEERDALLKWLDQSNLNAEEVTGKRLVALFEHVGIRTPQQCRSYINYHYRWSLAEIKDLQNAFRIVMKKKTPQQVIEKDIVRISKHIGTRNVHQCRTFIDYHFK